MENYQCHIQLHEISNYTSTKALQLINQQSVKVLKTEETSKEMKREHFADASKSLTCPTCGKVNNFMLALQKNIVNIIFVKFSLFLYRSVRNKVRYQIICALMNQKDINVIYVDDRLDFLYV